jgi:elongation factor G
MGELHLEVIMERLKRDHGVEVIASAPQVAYKQTISETVDVEGRHVRQNGGVGQYGIVNVIFEHDPTADPFTFVDEVTGGSVPREFIPSVEKGITKTLEEGGLLGVPIVNVKARLHFGKAHEQDSSDFSFQLAGIEAVNEMLKQSQIVLLEPRMKFEVECPDEFTGAVIGHLTSKRAMIDAIDQNGDLKSIRGIVPLSEMFRYTTDLRSMTSGRGSYTMEPHDYAPVPQNIANKVFEDAAKRQSKKG